MGKLFVHPKLLSLLILSFLVLWQTTSQAQTYNMPQKGNDVVGKIQKIRIKSGDTLYKISHKYDISVPELLRANPGIQPKRLLIGNTLIIPSQFILPPGPRRGIVINLAELRLYYFSKDGRKVMTYPLGIGRAGRATPLLNTKIVEKRKNPTWYVPQSILAEAASKGKTLPKAVPPGPKNPLGDYALRLNPRNYLIHGTNAPQSIGTRASAGCIRLYPEDIKQLYYLTDVNTPVRIINQPYKVGWSGNILYFQVSPTFADYRDKSPPLSAVINNLKQAEQQNNLDVDWQKVMKMTRARTGVAKPVAIL